MPPLLHGRRAFCSFTQPSFLPPGSFSCQRATLGRRLQLTILARVPEGIGLRQPSGMRHEAVTGQEGDDSRFDPCHESAVGAWLPNGTHRMTIEDDDLMILGNSEGSKFPARTHGPEGLAVFVTLAPRATSSGRPS